MVHKAKYIDHTKTFFISSKSVPFNELVKYFTLLLMHKAFHNLFRYTLPGVVLEVSYYHPM